MAKTVINKPLVDEVVLMQSRGTPAHLIKKHISKKTGWKKTKSAEVYREICSGAVIDLPEVKSADLAFWEENIETLDSPYFNKDTAQYVVFLKSIGRNVVVSEDKHKTILQMYTSWDGEEKSISQICRNIQWPRPVLTEYLKKFGITHDSLPVTDEDFQRESDEEIVGRLKELRKFSIHQKIEKESWDSIRADAAKWRAYSYKQYNPLVEFLSRFNPKPLNKIPIPKIKKGEGRTFLIGMSDIHWGQNTNGKEIFYKKGGDGNWSIEHTNKSIDYYFEQIKSEVESRNYPFEKVILCSLGDLLHTFTGFTEKGTKIDGFPIGTEQYDQAFNSLIRFITRCLEIFPQCEIHSVTGNHSLLDSIMFRAIKAYFRTEKRLSVTVYDTRFCVFKCYDTLFVAEHGASAFYKSKTPKSGEPLRAYIQSLFLADPKLLVGTNAKVFLSADIHTFKAEELGDIERYVFGTFSYYDKYADHSNWVNRPRQNCLIIDKTGVREIINIYLLN